MSEAVQQFLQLVKNAATMTILKYCVDCKKVTEHTSEMVSKLDERQTCTICGNSQTYRTR